ncbi:MAG TPA: Uma2 family endonuclease [Isosphaeraceae bacterium]|jgi:Uma2 family endonuclease|nr:Uma2 family endonuclease [Isosphaeraceae bacterium]
MSVTETLTVPAVGPDSAGILMTPEEFDAITEYDPIYDYELVHGVLVVNPIPSEMEAEPNELLGGLLFDYQEHHPQGSALDLTLQDRYIRLPNSRRKADRVIWAGLGRRPHPRDDVPTIIVEFVSPGKANWRRDYIEKRHEFLALGVREYWVIDRFRRTLTVYRDLPGAEGETVILEPQSYAPPLLPGFDLPLARLLAAADAWQEP